MNRLKEKIVKTSTVPSSSSSIIPPNMNRKPKAAPPRIASKRPLLVKASDTSSQPLLFFLTPTSSERCETTDNSKNVNLLNSYQKAKIRCADKFKCDICAKILYVLQPDICIGTFADIRVPQLQILGCKHCKKL